ncbi:MAG: hypothetical protein KGJ90_00125 [Patescibacteria group bacterium]|nr:hypothetical protein [Patescibacteria group bacterium]
MENDTENSGGTVTPLPKPWHFRPGQSGNPGGRPKADPIVKEILKAATEQAAKKLVALIDSEDERLAFTAASAVLQRVYGNQAFSEEPDTNQHEENERKIRGVLPLVLANVLKSAQFMTPEGRERAVRECLEAYAEALSRPKQEILPPE